ncbi:hypothetical protein [Hymenobacter lucidus]|uniref:Uncharacterized protein n=1 Tax=Hymenobacter lucidus TaxID=2880930 RepID=A0ABS8ALE0_9BACT|nr:hypothetical protein [Hymenobacter lucidus]MCB2406616.1 hypothetical protein [Hymenobacter lucidus]
MLRFLIFVLAGVWLFVTPGLAQKTAASDSDYLDWSATRRITAADFQLKLRPNSNLRGSNAMYHFGMEGHMFELLGKTGHNSIRNQLLRSASWLDTTNRADVSQQIRFQQTLFDIQEIYIRRMRQQVRANATKILLFGKPDVNELMTAQMKECQQRQVSCTEETNYAALPEKQVSWEQQILVELQELQAFAAKE